MKAFLLTAGLGTRLRPLTDDMPQCLLPLGGKPLLEIWLELLSRNDVDQVLINTHWHHEKVKQYISADYPSTIFRTYPSVICFTVTRVNFAGHGGAGADFTD